MPMVDCLMRTIALDTFGTLDMTNTHYVSPFPTVFTLRNTWVHICTIYCSDETSYIETLVNDQFGFGTILCVPDINPNDGYVWFQWDFDNSRPRNKNDVVENVIALENFLNVFRRDTYVWLLIQVRNSYDFEVGFWLRESRERDLISIIKKWTLDTFFDFL